MSNLVDEIKQRINIVDFMTEDGLELKSESSNRYTCLCPFHKEKTPSFKVNEEFQNFKCFGCGESGDVISYYAKRNLLNYGEAIKSLAFKLGIEDVSFEDHSVYYEITDYLCSLFMEEFNKLEDSHPAKQEIFKRNLPVEDYGYAPKGNIILNKILKKYSKNDLQELGFITEKNNLLWQDRLIFFIRDYLGKVIGFTGRRLDNKKEFKYVNSKSSVIYDKQKSLYNIDKAKKYIKEKDYVFLVEGTFDVNSMVYKGYLNTVSTNGTAVTKHHISTLLKCMSANGRIILVLDGDEAGQKAMYKILSNFKDIQKSLYIINLPNNEDPCSYLKEHSKLPKAELFLDFLFNQIINQNKETTEDKIKLEKSINSFIGIIKDDYIKNEYRAKVYPFIRTKLKNKVKQKEYSVDDYFCKSLAIIMLEPKIKFNINNYPKRYEIFIKEYLKNPQEITNQKLLNKINEYNIQNASIQSLQGFYDVLIKKANLIERANNFKKDISSVEGIDRISKIEEYRNV